MVEANPFQSRKGRPLHAWRPRQELALRRIAAQAADQLMPDSRRDAVRVQTAKPSDSGMHELSQAIQPPLGQAFRDLGSLQPCVCRVEPEWRVPRIRQRTATTAGKPILLTATDGGVDRDAIDRQVQPQSESVSRSVCRGTSDALIGGTIPLQCRMQVCVVGGDEYVSAGAWGKWWRDADDVEPHRAATREVQWPLR